MSALALLDGNALRQLARDSAAVTTACPCNLTDTAAWVSTPLSFPEQLLQDIGTLVADPYCEASFREYHPAGTRNDAPAAPIAPLHFPYNRCNIARCTRCGRCYLRYTEAGGYFVDRRIRALQRADLVVDVSPD
jgi:hypothetical protein